MPGVVRAWRDRCGAGLQRQGKRFATRAGIGMALAGALLQITPAFAEPTYQLGPGDVLNIHVYGQEKLSGQFKVSMDGKISYPALGSVDVQNLTRTEAEAIIKQRIAEQLPGSGRISVDVAEYAPVFILGDVEKPGRFEFRPGMIALELLALGGGTKRLMLDAKHDASLQIISLQQEIADLRLLRFSQAIMRARLGAEISSRDFSGSVAPSDDQPIMLSEKQRIIDNEKQLFRIRADVLKNREAALTQQRDSFNTEIESLTQSIVLHRDELKMISQEVDTSQSLVSRGLATEPKLLALKREQSATKRNALELQSFLARARQRQLAVETEIKELNNTRASELAKSIRDLDLEMARTDEKLATAMTTLAALGSTANAPPSQAEQMPMVFNVMRLIDGQYRTVQLAERDYVEPRDIVQVSRLSINNAISNAIPQIPASTAAATARATTGQIRTQ